jgi:steroid 5-alpha reductase family enzyme
MDYPAAPADLQPTALLPALAVGVAAVLALFSLVWLYSLKKRDVSLIDIFWGPGLALAAWVFALRGPLDDTGAFFSPMQWVYLALVSVWGLRLALHIAARHHGEDYRYRQMREKAGPSFAWRSLFTVFWLQAALVGVICLPHLFIQLRPRPQGLVATDYAALALFAIGFFFEVAADWQLQRFRNDPANKGKVLRTGLWRYSRHPNYFGDATIWLAFAVGALASRGGWVGFFSFALELFLLLKVSGVVLLEKTIVKRRPGYEDYISTTPAFFPWFPKRKSGRGRR